MSSNGLTPKASATQCDNGPMRLFHDRADAGRQLAERLGEYAHRSDVLVLGLPRGGIPVAYEVAARLAVPLDIFLVRKLGVPGHAELAMGAIAPGGIEVLNDDLIADLGISAASIAEIAARERLELYRRDRVFRGGRPLPEVAGKTVILTDDGLATGATMEAAVRALRQLSPAEVVVAVPVGARETCARFIVLADRVVCLATPEPFDAVGQWYENFSQTTDEEVQQLLLRVS
jgi:putative phosphoribosyl transferase